MLLKDTWSVCINDKPETIKSIFWFTWNGLLIHPSLYQSIFLPRYIPFRVIGMLEPLPATVGQRRGTPWAGRQFVTGHTIIPTHTHTCTLWEEDRVPGESSCMQRENMQTPHGWIPARIWSRAFLLWGTNYCATVQPSLLIHFNCCYF